MGEEDTSWKAMKKFLSQGGIIESILNYDARNVTKDIRNKVNKLIDAKPMSFEASVIAGVSRAAAPLAAWVKS
jgi:dynein heavy chain 2